MKFTISYDLYDRMNSHFEQRKINAINSKLAICRAMTQQYGLDPIGYKSGHKKDEDIKTIIELAKKDKKVEKLVLDSGYENLEEAQKDGLAMFDVREDSQLNIKQNQEALNTLLDALNINEDDLIADINDIDGCDYIYSIEDENGNIIFKGDDPEDFMDEEEDWED